VGLEVPLGPTEQPSEADFAAANFMGSGWFWRTSFRGVAWFGGTTFAGEAGFAETQFAKKVMFGGRAWFGGSRFEGQVVFHGTTFTEGVELTDARVKLSVPQDIVNMREWPAGWRIDRDEESPEWGRLTPG
jgi:hypothetical protein